MRKIVLLICGVMMFAGSSLANDEAVPVEPQERVSDTVVWHDGVTYKAEELMLEKCLAVRTRSELVALDPRGP